MIMAGTVERGERKARVDLERNDPPFDVVLKNAEGDDEVILCWRISECLHCSVRARKPTIVAFLDALAGKAFAQANRCRSVECGLGDVKTGG
jgi:hypothetical protein